MGLFSSHRSRTEAQPHQAANTNPAPSNSTKHEDPSLPRATFSPSRRAFLETVIGDSLTACGTVHIGRSLLADAPRLQKAPPTSEEPKVRTYPNTNEMTTLPSGESFHNLGVCHTGKRFEIDRGTIVNAIRHSDVVMLEGFAGQDYFDFLAAFAHEFKKVVVRLESGKSLLHSVGMQSVLFTAGYMTTSNALYLSDRVRKGCRQQRSSAPSVDPASTSEKRDVQRPAETARNSSLPRAATTALVGLNQHIFSPGLSAREFIEGHSEYPVSDTSYTLDGRTVIMLKEVEKWLRANPNRKLLVITGDLHAAGFSFYTSSPERFDLFNQRARVYETIYRSWLGGSARIEDDPVLTGLEPPFRS